MYAPCGVAVPCATTPHFPRCYFFALSFKFCASLLVVLPRQPAFGFVAVQKESFVKSLSSGRDKALSCYGEAIVAAFGVRVYTSADSSRATDVHFYTSPFGPSIDVRFALGNKPVSLVILDRYSNKS